MQMKVPFLSKFQKIVTDLVFKIIFLVSHTSCPSRNLWVPHQKNCSLAIHS